MRSFEKQLDKFRARGVQIAAISVDSSAKSRKLGQDQGYTFLFLSDPNAEVIRRYGVLHRGAGENGRDIARPAEFLVDTAGGIRWVNLTDDIRVRARPEIVLQEIDYLQLPHGARYQRAVSPLLGALVRSNPADALPSSTNSYSPLFQSHILLASFTVRSASFPATTRTM